MQRVKNVIRSSPAYNAGIREGDVLLKINNADIRDVLDYMYYENDAYLDIKYERDGRLRHARVRKNEDEETGLGFETGLMDKKKSCRNKCVFCFIDQLPRGMRETLYFKDDDERLSFLMGNYVTLTNLTERDLKRIKDMRISPLNISVHASDPETRALLLCNKRARPIMDTMRELAESGIYMNCQIVVCPGLNDGQVLENTLNELVSLYPGVPSISVVPVGLTAHREGLYPLRPVGKDEANAMLDISERIGKDCIERYGVRVVYPADELYIKAQRQIPPYSFYDDFPQLENGVGMLALFKDEFLFELEDGGGMPRDVRYTLVTGVAAAPYVREMADLASTLGAKCEVVPVYNDFFGRSIDVTGLTCASDIIKTLKGSATDTLVIPDCMLRDGNDRFLDDLTPEDIGRELNCRLQVIETTGTALARLLLSKGDPNG